MANTSDNRAWVTFCISTYKRPVLLKAALEMIARQTHPHFEIVISDNDPDNSAAGVVKSFNDPRVKYFSNGENLGMIRSFNRSIERASTEYIVMITDDDPVLDTFLEDFYHLINKHEGYPVYCGFLRKGLREGSEEIIGKNDFITEILDVKKTPFIVWSSCIMKRQSVLDVGKLPDYIGAHLADHAMIAMVGSTGGGIVVNKIYSHIEYHDNNFSRLNFHNYSVACREFYEQMFLFCKHSERRKQNEHIVLKHIGNWFIVTMFNLKRFYTVKKNRELVKQVNACASEIIAFPFMRRFVPRFYAKEIIFRIKKQLHLL